jgi:soluble lytic murein transglycosylase
MVALARHAAHAKASLHRCAFVWLLALVLIALGTADAFSEPGPKPALPQPSKVAKLVHHKLGSASKTKRTERVVGSRLPLLTSQRVAGNFAPPPQLSQDFAVTKQAIALVRQRKFGEAITAAASISDPVAQKLVDWALLRHSDSTAGLDRYVSFIQANPDWPSIPLLRQRAELRLWQRPRDAATVRRFIGGQPLSAFGRLALARVQLRDGDRSDAEREIRAVWHSAAMSAELEASVAQEFQHALSLADYAVRMDRRIGAKDFGAAMRAAKRLGPGQIAIVKACEAAEAKSTKSKTLLEAVPKEARADLGYALCHLHWLLADNDLPAAVKVFAESAHDDLQRQDTNEWWRECRILARRLIDLGDAKTAYRVVRQAAAPANPYYRAEYHFMAGWIVLRFLGDPSTALEHFTHIDEGSVDPIVLARAAYWRGRAAEAMGQIEEAHTQYGTAARYPTAYYGQLARARLGLGDLTLNSFPQQQSADGAGRELLHAADVLYTIGEFDLVLSFITDLAETSTDVAVLNALGQLTARYNDAQAMLVFGKAALARGLPTEQYAFPKIGIPSYRPIAPLLDQRVVYSIVRTESAFDQRDISPAKAVGLMQVTPEAGRDTAKRFGVAYDWKRLVSDPVYNMQMGAAEVSALFKEYTGSYIMTFAGYNAGRGRVRQWVAQHGDPRKVDAVDWVERIPLAETRNYVQRVMENLHMYSALFDTSTATVEPNLYNAATIDGRVRPASLVQVP